jgi:hypothetical protein
MNNKPEWLSGLGTLLLAALGVYASHHTTNTGEVAVPKELLVDTAVVVGLLVLWLVSWLVVFWRRDTKRARIRFARESGRHICPCTEVGEIMETRIKKGDPVDFDALVCPRCQAWLPPDEPMFRDQPHDHAA